MSFTKSFARSLIPASALETNPLTNPQQAGASAANDGWVSFRSTCQSKPRRKTQGRQDKLA